VTHPRLSQLPSIFRLILTTGALALAVSCGSSKSSGTDSSTHWLKCSADADCEDDGLLCVEGFCREPPAATGGAVGSGGSSGGTGGSDATGGTSGSSTGGSLESGGAGGAGNATGAGGASGSGGDNGGAGGGTGGSGDGSGGSAAAGGSAGTSGGTAGSGGEAGMTDPPVSCQRMEVRGEPLPCTSSNGFFWAGGACMPFRCEMCTGADCGNLYSSASECDRAHASCYDDLGLSQACQYDSDCVMVRRSCCGDCGLNGEDMLMGISVNAEQTYRDRCQSAACAGCVSTDDPKAYTYCSQGLCTVGTMP
jgi:hypothetical protein